MTQTNHRPISPLDLFINKINASRRTGNAQPITRHDIQIAEVKSVMGVDGTNTAVRITASTKSMYSGENIIRIKRTDIASLLYGKKVVLDPSNCYNLVELLPSLERLYGIKLEHTDIINAQLPSTFPSKIWLRMSPNNLALTGMVEVELKVTGTDLGDIFQDLILADEMYAINKPNLITAELLLRSYNFVAFRDELEKITVGTRDSQTIAELLETVTGMGWVRDPKPSDFNLYGAVTLAPKDDDDGDRVVIVKLNPNYCLNLAGQLELYYK